MIKKATFFILFAAIIGSIFLVGCHARKFRTLEGKIDYIEEKIVDELDLTDAQQKILGQMKLDILDKIAENKEEREKMHREALERIKTNSIDKTYLNKVFDKKETLHRKMRPFIIEKIIQFNNMLDDGQRALLVEKIEEMKNKHCAQ